MSVNRLRSAFAAERLPRPASPEIAAGAFLLYPIAWLPGSRLIAQFSIYQRAFEEAQAVARPSLPERDLLGVWN